MRFREHEAVVLKEDYPPYRKGTRGVVVFLFPQAPEEVLVEFFGEGGETLGVESVPVALLLGEGEEEGKG